MGRVDTHSKGKYLGILAIWVKSKIEAVDRLICSYSMTLKCSDTKDNFGWLATGGYGPTK